MTDKFESFEVTLSEEIRKKQKINPAYYYAAKLSSIKLMQRVGLSDALIEKLLGFKIAPKDKNK